MEYRLCPSRYGTVRFGMLWTTREVVHHATILDRFSMGMVRFRCVQAPLWRGMVPVQHALREQLMDMYGYGSL